MTKYSVVSYEAGHLAQAAELLAKSRRERRKHCPLLPAGLDDASTAERILKDGIEGSVLLSGEGELGGFLFATRQEDRLWGDAVVAQADDWAFGRRAGQGDIARLYAAGFAPRTRGALLHKILCPAYDNAMLDAWFHLGFGLEQAYAVAPLREIDAREGGVRGLTIRRAAEGDEEILASLSPLIATMQAEAPVWAGAPASYLEQLRQGFSGLATDKEALVFIAFLEGKAVGYQAWFPVEQRPVDGESEGGIELSVSATLPEERGKGIGLALTARARDAALAAGYSTCFADWRSANPLSSTFWTARGFRPFLYRLVRRLDPQAL
jgi:GNAT superfamily N-acetyltransferase